MNALRTISLILCFLLSGSMHAQGQELESISFPQLEVRQQQQPRHTLVFLYTDWCRFCAAMKKTTFKDPDVVEKLNKEFYFVPFDGEKKETVNFLGARFEFKPTGIDTGTHQLAEQLGKMEGKVSYPSVVMLDPQYQIVFQHNAYLDSEQLMSILDAFTTE